MRLFNAVLHFTHIHRSEAGCPAWPRALELAPPAAVETERVLLGTILVDPTQLIAVAEILPPHRGTWFYDEPNRLIFDATLTLMERHDPIDLVTVTDVLRRRGDLEKVGGSVYLAELTEMVISTANCAHHARIVRDKCLYRSLINLSTTISAGAYSQDDLPEMIHQAQQTLLHVGGAQSTASFETLYDLMRTTIRHAQQVDSRDLTGINTGFHALNSMTCGFQPSQLIILAARPSIGKSALALQFALAAAQSMHGLPVAVFSLEMSKEELGVRLLCSEAGIDSRLLKRGWLSRDQWGPIFDAGARLDRV
jgi:replicative DNA helicase